MSSPSTLPTEVVDDVQNPEPTTIGELIGHEVDGPALVRPGRYEHRDPRPRQLLTPFGANLKPFLGKDPAPGSVVVYTQNQSRIRQNRNVLGFQVDQLSLDPKDIDYAPTAKNWKIAKSCPIKAAVRELLDAVSYKQRAILVECGFPSMPGKSHSSCCDVQYQRQIGQIGAISCT